ncbi:NAD(+) diphosphatase [Stenotrophomonas sp. SORGH_AS_0282]|uniref:NAD(+) diphosphatase n=1 Tax=Stenotrophomonas sp. SORGH_AS_0282 TaxID=3041763 RepID=UPI00277E9322|nr:NAD(+) diphosphatase [Stenotrophomonas sp. SORGH_AS_0282]MDQ1061122.1 NAD+ diphosphatase [Stenotrophomonas sp. SORGH_AS_0282]MDQ1190531.1 NAD+ diphosphatase [Stenotrophomonas sp. SORGH_AS_0282]
MSNVSLPLAGFAFTTDPLERADTLRDDADALLRLWPQAHVLVLDPDGRALAGDDGQPLALTGAKVGGGPGTAIFLGLRGEQAWFSVESAAVDIAAPQRVDLRESATTWSAADASAFCYARGMSYWRSRTRFCGVCGGAVAFTRGGFIGRCVACSTEHYPRVDPAVIVAVESNGRLLLGRQANWAPRRYSVLAGFVEPGESLEQTVVREVYEESKVRVRSCRYLGTQPWPFPGALMLGFSATAEDDVPTVDGELEDARWFTAEEVGAALARDIEDDGAGIRLSPPISISRSLIEHWYRSQVS